MRELAGYRLAFLLATAVCGCLVDSDSPCGDQLQVNERGACVCPAGFTASGGVCVAEAPAEQNATATCAAGTGCECESSRGCPSGELCDSFGSGRCSPAPAGLGNSCSASAECASGEATFCDLFASHTCQVQGCKQLAGDCPGDYICCDYAVLSTSLCIPADTSPDGGCPSPGQLVTRSGP
jgi:hypothetical protein